MLQDFIEFLHEDNRQGKKIYDNRKYIIACPATSKYAYTYQGSLWVILGAFLSKSKRKLSSHQFNTLNFKL